MDNRLDFNGSSVLGVFVRCTDDFALLPREATDEFVRTVKEELNLTVIKTTVDSSNIIGSLCCGNSRGFLTSERVTNAELNRIRKFIPARRLPGFFTAAGNNVLINDTAALVNPNLMDRAVDKIRDFLGVDVHRGTIGGIKTVGMAACVTNKGLLVHPKASKFEIDMLEELFSLPVDIGTVNLGSPLVGSGLIANSKGYIVGRETTGHEMGRIDDALGF